MSAATLSLKFFLLMLLFQLFQAQSCTDGTYLDTTTNSCQPCDSSCSTCNGSTAADCTACNYGILYAGTCYPPCDTSMYFNTSFLGCDVCSPSCSECTGPTASDCTTCNPPNTLVNGVCKCQTGQYLDVNGICQTCNTFCSDCDGALSTNCLACYNNMVLSAGQCLCPENSAMDITGKKCVACSDSCAQCSTTTPATCQVCQNNLTLSATGDCTCTGNTYLDTTTYTCQSCPTGTFFSNGACTSCDATCATCSGSGTSACLTCPSGMTLSASNTCTCNAGTYWDSTSSSCKACNGSCQACTGPLATDCSTCKTGLTKGSNGACGCTGSTFLDTTTYTCKACDATCATCSGSSASTCLTCPSGMTLSAATKTCTCNQGTYWNSSTSSCQACYGTCQSCSGPLSSQCSTCQSGLQKAADGTCGCASGKYLNTASFTCGTCNSGCNECSGPSANQCLSCPSGMQLSSSNTCECPAGKYLDSATKTCKACQGSCQACTGPLVSDCSTCKTGLTKGTNGICGCTGNTYLNTNTYTCESCSSTCDGCSGPSTTQCSSCKSGLTMSDDGTCQCPISTYFNEQTGQCSACDSSCDHCSGPNPSDCSACPANQVLIGGVCSTCPSGTYITGTTCESCSTSCAECSGSSYDQCTSCNSGWTYNNGKCIQSCSQGQYNAQDGSCSACDSSCLECSGSGSNSCLSCAPGQILTNGQCTAGTGVTSSLCPEGLIFVEDQNTCLSQCPPSYYISYRGSDPVCLAKVVIQNAVKTTSKIDQYRIVFNADITGIYAQLAAITSVTIELIAAQQPAIQYNTTLSLYSDSQSILVTFDITGHLLPANIMLITFNLPDDNHTTYTLLNNQLSSQMFEYYSYSSGTQDAISATSKMNEVGQKTNEVITWGTSFILQSIHSIRSELMESMIAYCIYMNITYPPNFVSYAMGNLNANDMFLPNVPWLPILNDLSAKNNVDDVDGYNSRLLQESGTMDDVGQGLGVKASDLRFLSDVGSSVTFLLIILILVGVFDLFVYILQRKKMQGKIIYKVTEYLNYHFKWSYLINEFISEFMGLTFAPLVALVYTKVFTPDVVFDYVFAVIIFSLTIISMAGILYLVRYIHKLNHQRSDPAAIAAAVVTTGPERVVTDGILVTAGAPIETSNPEDPASSHESSSQHGHNEAQKPILIRLNVLHIEYNNRTYLQLLYPFFLMLRCFGFSLVLALSQSSPIFQCIYLMLATLGIMIYIALIKPFRKRVQQILSLIYEGILFIVAVLCLTLHLYTLHNILDIDTRSSIAFGIVAGALIMMIFNFVALFFEIAELLHHLKKTKIFHRLKNLKFWKKSMPVGPMEQLTRADTKQHLEETQHSHLNTQLTSSNSNLLKMGIRKSISIENYAKPIGSSKEISFTEEVNRTDEGTLTLNNIPTEPQVKANNDSSASIFKFYKYSMKDVDHEIKEDPEEVVNESFKREKEEPISSLNKLNGLEEYDAFNCSSIDKLDSIIRKERESENSLKGHDADSKISLPGSGNDTLKEGLQQEALEIQQQEHEVGKSKFKPKKSRSKSKEKTKGHKRSLNSIAAIFGFTYTDVSGKSVISKATPNKSSSKKIAPFPKRVDWSSEMVSQGDTGRQIEQIEEKNFSGQDEEKENEYTRTVMSAREEKNNTWNNTLDMKIMLNSARNNELQYFNNQTSSQKDSEDNTMDKFIRVQPFESLESLPLDKDESSVEYQASKEDIQDTNQTPTKEKLRHKVFNMQMKKLRSMKSVKSMKSIDENENDEEPKVNTEQSDIIVVQDEGNRSRQRVARPLGRKREEGSLDRIERKKQGQLKGKAERKFSLNAKKE